VSSPRQSSTLGKTDRRIFAAKRYFHSLWNDSKVDVLSEIASERYGRNVFASRLCIPDEQCPFIRE
jgi:hypothetical protein